jgi:hypothetical protein
MRGEFCCAYYRDTPRVPAKVEVFPCDKDR